MVRQQKVAPSGSERNGNFALPLEFREGDGEPAGPVPENAAASASPVQCADVSSWACPGTLQRRVFALAVASATLMGACGAPLPEPARKEVVMWKQLGSWSGRGNAQTESFVGLTGSLRLRWRTTHEDPKGQGRFKLILQSAISGRALQEPVDEEGPGEGTAYAADDPRVFHILVESANLDWSFTVEEAAFGTVSQ